MRGSGDDNTEGGPAIVVDVVDAYDCHCEYDGDNDDGYQNCNDDYFMTVTIMAMINGDDDYESMSPTMTMMATMILMKLIWRRE